MSTLRAAERYVGAGFAVVPIPHAKKRPILEGWERLRLSADELPAYFNGQPQNIGIILGAASRGLVDVDLDVSEAVKIAGRFLTPTRTSGRESSPDSHWWYFARGAKTATFKDVEGEALVELRADGRQTLVAPSVHPEGDRYVWATSGLQIAEIPPQDLARQVRELATTALIARHVPPVGGRHDYALAVAGFLLRGRRLDENTVLKIMLAAWHAAGADSREAVRDLEGIVCDTAEDLRTGEPVVGGPTLDETTPGVVRLLRKWWQWGREREAPTRNENFHSSAPRDGVADERILRFKTAKELAEETPAVTEWVARPWVARGAITEVDGKIKAGGKTTWVTHMVRKILDGEAFMGEPTTRTKAVFLTEQPPASFRKALERADLLEREDLLLLHWHDTRGVTWPEVARAAVEKSEEIGAGVLFVDTLGQFAGIRGDGENNAGAAQEAMRPLQEAAARGLAVVLTRHERKGGGEVGESGRGSSAFGGAVDVILSLRRGEGNTRPTVRIIESLSRFDETPSKLVIELTEGGYRSLGDATAFAEQEAMKAIVELLPSLAENALGSADILDKLKEQNIKRTVATDALAKLADAGTIRRVGAGKKGDPYRYHKPEEAQ